VTQHLSILGYTVTFQKLNNYSIAQDRKVLSHPLVRHKIFGQKII